MEAFLAAKSSKDGDLPDLVDYQKQNWLYLTWTEGWIIVSGKLWELGSGLTV